MGPDRRLNHGRGRDSEGDGLCHDRRSASAGRSLHSPRADDDLRHDRNVPVAQREHNNDAGHSCSERPQPRCRRRAIRLR
jgi:hypothetical protein